MLHEPGGTWNAAMSPSLRPDPHQPGRQPGPIGILQRTLDAEVARALEDVPSSRLPQARLTGWLGEIHDEVRDATLTMRRHEPWLAGWLVEDIGFLMRLFAEITGAVSLALRLEAVRGDACCRFHADNVVFRLVTTYRGPGTEWVSPRDARLVSDGHLLEPAALRRLEPGWVAIMRGRKAGGNTPPLLHRSPPLGKNQPARLFLAIDGVWH